MKKMITGHQRFLILVLILAVIFFILYSYLAFNTADSWYSHPKLILNSPDATANLYFSRLYATENKLSFTEPANQVAQGLVAPRSTKVINGLTVPAGFLGLPFIYGSLAKIFSVGFIPFMTPLMAVIGVVFFYLLISRLFNAKTGLIASILLLILPGYWYYATKGLMPNVLFVSLLIISAYYLVLSLKQGKLVFYSLFGLFFGLSLLVRPSEIIWMLLALILVLIFYFSKIRWSYLVVAGFCAFLGILPLFLLNYQVYGQFFSIGYENEFLILGDEILKQPNLWWQIIMPFGFHPRLAWHNLFNYTFGLFPIWTILAMVSLAGFVINFYKKQNKNGWFYFSLMFLVGGYLVIYYGSWLIQDNPVVGAVTIGTSYVRYWLPLYLLFLPVISLALLKFVDNYKKIAAPLLMLVMLILLTFSFKLVWLDPDEGLLKVQQNITYYQYLSKEVSAITEENAIIIAERLDKAFFPMRSVIFKLENEDHYVRVRELLKAGYPVYYFNFTRQPESLEEFNQKFFRTHGLIISDSLKDFEEQSLYQINLLPNNESNN